MTTRSLTATAWVGILSLTCLSVAVCRSAHAETTDPEKGFAAPPASARPWVYWFPLSGNLTKEGITADLEAMAWAGIGGVLYMEVDQGAPKGPADFASPQWRALIQHACNEAHRLGLEINMNNDAGWCGSGGPWITPELSMQKVVWSETFITGGKRFEGVLPQPPRVRDFYRDIAALAFPTPPGEDMKMSDAAPKFSTSGKILKAGPVVLPHPEAEHPQFIQVEFPQPFTARTLMATASGRHLVHGVLEVSGDGKTFKQVHRWAITPPALVLTFEPATARFFRLTVMRHDDRNKSNLTISNLELTPRYCLSSLQGKSSLTTHQLPAAPAAWPAAPAEIAIPRERIVDLAANMDATGKLTWDAPAGKWTILRFGHTSTGKDNHPAPESGRGLECDKFSKEAATAMFNGLMAHVIADSKAATGAGKTLVATHIDSWEVGSQNWTPRMREEFRQRRGYDLWTLLPTFTGRVVDSMEVTERFLWDLRQTVSDLLVENYAGQFRRLANKHGLRLSIEAYGEPADDMAYAGQADEPMGEFWAWAKFGAAVSCTRMASAGHVYGKRIIGAEAFTATDQEKWQGHPANVKDLGDWAFCEGINRFVFHRYAAQPWRDVRPGMSMGPWGLHYERTQTWWEQSRAWHEYLARCQFLLQQGLFVADVAYLQPEGAPRAFAPPPDAEIAPHIRGGYNFDLCSPEVVLTRMAVNDGRIVLPDGMNYRVLVLPPMETITPSLLRKIKELADNGATILADAKPPQKSPSLADMGQGDVEVEKLAAQLWPKLAKGKTAAQLLAERGVKPDFSARPVLRYIHRTLGDAEIYFVTNPESHSVEAVADFRVVGKQPELWRPDSGRIAPALAFTEHDGLISVPLRLEPSGSVFVVFRRAANAADQVVSVTRDGKELLPPLEKAVTAPPPPAASKTFTLAVWVKPEGDTGLSPETNSGISAMKLPHNFLLYPPPGHEVWTASDAGAGLAVGNNGVCVFEHGANHFPAVLVHAATVTDWTHVAVVYRDGTPSLYVNGKLARSGLKSRLTVHGGAGVTHTRRIPPFKGQRGEVQQFARALSDEEIRTLAQTSPPGAEAEELPPLDLAQGTFWQSGNYVTTTADGTRRQLKVSLPPPQEIAGPWEVQFDPKWGPFDFAPGRRPGEFVFERLDDWSKRPEEGIRYYSGTAVYHKTFSNPQSLIPKHRLFLDLGRVAVMAEVKLNGRDLGILWKPPFCVDVSEAIKPGENSLEVKVVNLWINRQIGDEQLPEDSDRNPNGTLKSWPAWLSEGKPSPTGRYTFSSWRLWKKGDPLVESGLLGPVMIRAAASVKTQ